MRITPARVAILGGGIAACVLARRLGSMRGVTVDLIEETGRLGGRDLDRAVAHLETWDSLFSVFPSLRDLLVEIEHRPLAILADGRLVDFPPRPAPSPALLASKWRHRHAATLRSWAAYHLGERALRASGALGYIERFYATPAHLLDADAATGHLAALADVTSLRRRAWRAVDDVMRFREAVYRRAWAPVAYVPPRAGLDAAFAHIACDLRFLGVRMRLGEQIAAVDRVEGELVVSAGRGPEGFDRVISTLPIEETAALMGLDDGGSIRTAPGRAPTAPVATARLGMLASIALTWAVQEAATEPGDLVHNLSGDGAWSRLRALPRRAREGAAVVVECTMRDEVAATLDDEGIAALAHDVERHLRATGLVAGLARLLATSVTRAAYPLPLAGHRERLIALRRAIAAIGVELAGGAATFREMSIGETVDHARVIAGTARATRAVARVARVDVEPVVIGARP